MAGSRHHADLVIANAAEVLTCVPTPSDPIGRIRGGSVAVAGERIVAVGTAAEVAAQVDTASAQVIDASGKVVATHSQRIPLVGPVDQLGRARGQSVPFVRRVQLGPGDYTLEVRSGSLPARTVPVSLQRGQVTPVEVTVQ